MPYFTHKQNKRWILKVEQLLDRYYVLQWPRCMQYQMRAFHGFEDELLMCLASTHTKTSVIDIFIAGYSVYKLCSDTICVCSMHPSL